MKMTSTFVIGDPITHSRSPLIHNYWIGRNALNGEYQPIHVPDDGLNEFIARLRAGEYAGGNVTIPHKENVARLVDVLTDTARTIGAVNTLWRDEAGAVHGDNTDAYGFSANMNQQAPQWQNANNVLIIGAGGAARAIIHACLENGMDQIVVANRTRQKAEHLADTFGASVSTIDWDERNHHVAKTQCIINTTALGMHGQPPLDLALDRAGKDCIVSDIVYVPLETPLLSDARKRGLATVDGLGMLLHQAVPGFARWHGIRPIVDSQLRERVIDDLERRAS